VLTGALANGGKVLWPRLVSRIESQDPTSMEPPTTFPAGRVRDHLGVNPRHLQIVRDAMVAETDDPEGTAYKPLREYYSLPGAQRLCGKTGTAEWTERGQKRNTTWFISFAPYEPKARYAVVVMVEDGVSGGATCAPVARDIYKELFHLNKPVGRNAVALSP
jgi:cell division protein FtsI/penicillin-binding protein 2